MSRVLVRGHSVAVTVARPRTRPRTEWELKSPEERAAIVNAPFPPIDRHPGKSWAGVIVVDEADDPLARVYKPSLIETGDGSIDNLFRSLEG